MDNGEIMYWLAIIKQANKGNTDAQEMLQAENELRAENNQPTVQEELMKIVEAQPLKLIDRLKMRAEILGPHKPYINPDPNEKDLNKILMEDGKQTAQEWLMTQPESWRPEMTEAIYECLKRGWTLHTMSIQSTARELDAQRNPKGW